MRISFLLSIISGLFILSFMSTEKSQNGKKIYDEFCATCHGEDLQGGNARSLVDNDWQFGYKKSHVFRNVKYGINEHGMPGFEGTLLDEDIRDVLAYLKDQEGKTEKKDLIPDKSIKTLDYTIRVQVWVDGLEIPWAIDFPEPTMALITERPGRLRVVRNGELQSEPVKDIPQVLHKGQGGLLDVAVDIDYMNNGWIYLAYSHALVDERAMTRLVRGRIRNNTWVDQQVLFEANPEHYLETRHHYGCRIVFDKKGFLYFSIGERGRQDHAQDLSRPNGKLHRIYPDGTIPADNPFLKNSGAVASIYTYGNRNPQGLAVHPITDQVWETEHGPMGGDELNLIQSGANYGWPVITYGKNYDGTTITDQRRKEGMAQPVKYWRPSTAVCGLDYYRGEEFPFWQNHLLVGALKYEEVRLVEIERDRVLHEEVILKNYGRVRDVSSGPDGAIYVVLNEPGQVLRLTREE